MAKVLCKSLRRIGFPNYCVGEDGSVWTNWSKRGCTGPWRRLRIRSDSHGRSYVDLFDGKVARKAKRWQVHRLVLTMFVGPCPPGMVCRHFPDPNPANCHLDNLRWGTPQENEADKVTHGTSNRGARNGQAKFTEDEVRQIRAMYATGRYRQKDVAAAFGTTQPVVSEMVNKKSWVDA